MIENDIQFLQIDSLAFITLNRPQALNALTFEMVTSLYQQLKEWENNPNVKAVVIQNTGNKAFCAGGDIKQVYENRDHPNKGNQFFWREYQLNHYIHHYPKPYIALLDGITMGGGVGISLHGNTYRIATANFTFAMPETGIGFFPDVGGTYLLSRCPGYTGTYLALTGARLKAADAIILGLIDYFIPAEKKPLLNETLVSTKFTSNTQADIKTVIQSYNSTPPAASLTEHRQLIDECFKFDTLENILAALQQQDNEWSTHTLKTLQSKSPMSLKVTLQALRRATKLNFDQCMQMEYRLATHFLANNDFYEGVRAVLVDKDQKPKWQPNNIQAVTQEMVDTYFALLPNIEDLDFAS